MGKGFTENTGKCPKEVVRFRDLDIFFKIFYLYTILIKIY